MLDLTNRQDCFYWQTDRNLSPQDFENFFLKRHQTPDSEIIRILNDCMSSIKISSLKLIPADENVVKGSVNIVRKILIDEKEYVVRMHPKGIKNGYFYVEKLLLAKAKDHGLPVPQILEVHEARDENDMDFVLMSVSNGMTMDIFLSKDKSHENELLENAGEMMAKLHEIQVEGFGFFDNKAARKGKLVGLHTTNAEFIMTALEENLQRLVSLSVCAPEEIESMREIMLKYTFEPENGPVIVHNDFADWNLLTNGKEITAILDWDEACGGDAVADLACWSMFFDIERYMPFLDGYKRVGNLPEDYELRFHYYRLRYAISKMALRAKRYIVDTSDFVKDKLIIGKKALTEEVKWFAGQ